MLENNVQDLPNGPIKKALLSNPAVRLLLIVSLALVGAAAVATAVVTLYRLICLGQSL